MMWWPASDGGPLYLLWVVARGVGLEEAAVIRPLPSRQESPPDLPLLLDRFLPILAHPQRFLLLVEGRLLVPQDLLNTVCRPVLRPARQLRPTAPMLGAAILRPVDPQLAQRLAAQPMPLVLAHVRKEVADY